MTCRFSFPATHSSTYYEGNTRGGKMDNVWTTEKMVHLQQLRGRAANEWPSNSLVFARWHAY